MTHRIGYTKTELGWELSYGHYDSPMCCAPEDEAEIFASESDAKQAALAEAAQTRAKFVGRS